MLPRKEHLDQINRYHAIEKMRKDIDAENDKNKKTDMISAYLKVVDIWPKIDDVIEFTIKHTLDCIENGDIDELE